MCTLYFIPRKKMSNKIQLICPILMKNQTVNENKPLIQIRGIYRNIYFLFVDISCSFKYIFRLMYQTCMRKQ